MICERPNCACGNKEIPPEEQYHGLSIGGFPVPVPYCKAAIKAMEREYQAYQVKKQKPRPKK
jgi:hypothetical protein